MTDNKIIEELPKEKKEKKQITLKEMKETTMKEKKEKKQVASKGKKEKKQTTSKENSETTFKESSETGSKENNYDVNMTFLDDNQVKVEVKKQPGEDEDCDDGEEVLKDILKPKISSSYQEEIDKLEDMIKMIKTFPISDDPDKKDQVIDQLKNTLAILMTQSKNLIKEMQQMSRRNSYFKNNIILAAFILDKCRKDVPETEEEFDNMFN